jgi:NAD+ synthetase
MKAFDTTLAEPFAGTEEGIAEENIQSRIRGTLLMALSNKHGDLVLATGNKSEYAVGYATLYGDMAGGFAPLKDVYKTVVYELCAYRNATHRGTWLGPAGTIIPQTIIDKAPSAELRPDQLDTDSLPDYDDLDAILGGYIERYQSVDRLVAEGHDRATVAEVTRMVDRAEYKRRQAPPGVKVTQRAFGRERRLPITHAWAG